MLAAFKSQITNTYYCLTTHKLSCFYTTGSRYLLVWEIIAVILTMTLFLNKLRPDATCEKCGHERDNVEHYFMPCPSYTNVRLLFSRATRHLHPFSISTLLQGKESSPDEETIFIFNQAQSFIRIQNVSIGTRCFIYFLRITIWDGSVKCLVKQCSQK